LFDKDEQNIGIFDMGLKMKFLVFLHNNHHNNNSMRSKSTLFWHNKPKAKFSTWK